MSGVKRILCGLAAALALAAIAPALAAGATVSGTVSDEVTDLWIAGVDVCFQPQPEAFETECDETDATGHYEVPGLPAGGYYVRFSADRNNLKYITEFFDDAQGFLDRDLFNLEAGGATLDAELAVGGAIAGTLSDETSGMPVAGVRACALDSQGFWPRCVFSDGNGEYLLNGVPSGAFRVEYEGGNLVNYLYELYEDAATGASATHVAVTAPATSSGIDAELAPGAEILGRVSDVGSGAPAADVMVCAEEPAPGEYQACAWTDPAGAYAIRSLPAGTYLVSFGLEYVPFGGLIAGQWWQGAATAAEADPIVIAPPEARAGIDGQVADSESPGVPSGIGATTISPPPSGAQPRAKPKKCKRGFQRKTVKGKRRCVRKQKQGQPRRKQGSAGKTRAAR